MFYNDLIKPAAAPTNSKLDSKKCSSAASLLRSNSMNEHVDSTSTASLRKKGNLSKSVKFPHPPNKLKQLKPASGLARSHSALECYSDEEKHHETKLDADNAHQNLFFNYSKLMAIESNLERQAAAVINRPRTAFTKLNIPTVNLNEQDQPLLEETIKLVDKKSYEKINSIDDEEANWQHLPDEIWLKILKYLRQTDLAQFALTCKKFHKLYLDGSLCNSFNLNLV